MNKYKYSYLDDKGIYCYEGSDVLINKLNIRDEKIFYKSERLYSSIRQSELNSSPLKGDFDFNYLKAIHHYLFQDLFYWAGKVRTVAIANLLGDINALHPFREGNGRTQREFIRCIGLLNGYGFDWSLVSSEENIIASYESVNGDNTKLKAIITKIIFKI